MQAWPVVKDPFVRAVREDNLLQQESRLERSVFLAGFLAADISASGNPRSCSLPCCGAKLESKRHNASAVQLFFAQEGPLEDTAVEAVSKEAAVKKGEADMAPAYQW